jgi:hypothetical protein
VRARQIVLGYQNPGLGGIADDVEGGLELIEAFAGLEGYLVGPIFVETDAARPLSALAALMASARKWHVYKVIVPSAADLGLLPEDRAQIVQRLGDEANLRVLEAARIPGAPVPEPDSWDDEVVDRENGYDVAFFNLPIVRESTLGFNS